MTPQSSLLLLIRNRMLLVSLPSNLGCALASLHLLSGWLGAGKLNDHVHLLVAVAALCASSLRSWQCSTDFCLNSKL